MDDLPRAADAVFVYDPTLLSAGVLMGEIRKGLMGKAPILSRIIATQSPPDERVTMKYMDALRNIMRQLDEDIERLEHRLSQLP